MIEETKTWSRTFTTRGRRWKPWLTREPTTRSSSISKSPSRGDAAGKDAGAEARPRQVDLADGERSRAILVGVPGSSRHRRTLLPQPLPRPSPGEEGGSGLRGHPSLPSPAFDDLGQSRILSIEDQWIARDHMDRRWTYALLPALVACLNPSCPAEGAMRDDAAKRPNILILLADDWRWDTPRLRGQSGRPDPVPRCVGPPGRAPHRGAESRPRSAA